MSSHLFKATNKYHLIIKGDGNLVVCDIDGQPHSEDTHPTTYEGKMRKCQNPLKWTTKGIVIDELPL